MWCGGGWEGVEAVVLRCAGMDLDWNGSKAPVKIKFVLLCGPDALSTSELKARWVV